ncbi:F-box domain-containing protein [Mycena indigotica]|uniref:F-box domain-containing protein n=1 Tax=Mycena indigotica TaxID=2126181 RepID=A0A8H6RYB2_9AGAR|nr:F-box domain-containing protein [Mycena indigotica]KAF7289153.1 F-box domain-containing protein [Mycena indigotica]
MLNARYQGAAEATAFLHGLRRLTLELLDPPTKSKLREEAEQLKQAIGELKTKLASLEDRLDAIQLDLSCLVYPINTLPNEILCNIFAAAVSSSLQTRVEANRIRLEITAVCRHWRSIAIADPRLWTQTYYGVKPGSEPCLVQDRIFERFLPRVRDLPIKYTVDLQRQRWLPRRAFNSVAQWQEASLTSRYWPDCWDGNPAPNGSTICPRLTKLTVNVEDPVIKPSHLVMEAPHLRDLSINVISGLLSHLLFPTHQLKILTLLEPPAEYAQLLLLLTQLSGLEELSISMTSPFEEEFIDDEDWSSKPPVRLPRLSNLSLGTGECFFLKFLDLPALTTLHLSRFDEESAQLLGPSVIRSSASITSLFLEPTSYAAYCTAISSVVDSVKHLTVTLFDMNTHEAKECSADLARLGYLPNLESMTFVTDKGHGGGNVKPFLEGIAMRIANALFGGAAHEIKLTGLVLDSRVPGMIPAEDMRSLVYLQKSLRSMQAK